MYVQILDITEHNAMFFGQHYIIYTSWQPLHNKKEYSWTLLNTDSLHRM